MKHINILYVYGTMKPIHSKTQWSSRWVEYVTSSKYAIHKCVSKFLSLPLLSIGIYRKYIDDMNHNRNDRITIRMILEKLHLFPFNHLLLLFSQWSNTIINILPNTINGKCISRNRNKKWEEKVGKNIRKDSFWIF